MPSWSRAWGPLGSVFSRDDFSDREVKDTDGDGLPEFVDAWGQPLQFFRWPLLYHTDTQRGAGDRLLGLHADSSLASRRRALQPAVSLGLRGAASRTRWTPTSSSWRRPGGRRSQNAQPARRSWHWPVTAAVGRRQRRGAGLRVLLPPAHRAVRDTRGPRHSTGTGARSSR